MCSVGVRTTVWRVRYICDIKLYMQLNRLKLAEKEKDALEGDRQKADEFLRLDAAIRKKQNVLYQCHMAQATVNVEKVSYAAII